MIGFYRDLVVEDDLNHDKVSTKISIENLKIPQDHIVIFIKLTVVSIVNVTKKKNSVKRIRCDFFQRVVHFLSFLMKKVVNKTVIHIVLVKKSITDRNILYGTV